MSISNRALFILATLVAFGLRISIARADVLPGYIGQMSFSLSDDYDLNNYMRRAEDAKREFANIDQSRDQMQDQFNTISRSVEQNRSQLNQLESEINQLKDEAKGYQDRINTLNQNEAQNKDQITQLQGQLTGVQNQISQKTNQYGQLKISSSSDNVRLDQIKSSLNDLINRANQARSQMEYANRERENYENQLVSEIMRSNQSGASQGSSDGTNDGSSLASRLGMDLGRRDGNSDGNSQGIADGKERDYKRGNNQGDLNGSARAKTDGERDGTAFGTRDGNIQAADREADAAGVARANNSDAAKVGEAQGKIAGLDHAKRQGRIDGEDKAEKEVVNKFESSPLQTIQLNGQFAGSFSRRSPSYPGDFNGPSYRPDTYASKSVVQKAYTDGYVNQYRSYTREGYNYNIDQVYNSNYDSSYSSSYNVSYNQNYQDSYNQGLSDGDSRAYNRDYPVVKDQFYQIYFNKFDQSPNRTSSEFKNQYSISEPRAYNRHYEEIRSAHFDQIELTTFNSNIAEQTEIFHVSRTKEVNAIYNQNAILQFDSSSIFDGGIEGVAKLDGVFQIGESTLHNVVIKNFGFKAAENARVKINGSQEIKLPAIPARSIVTIVGAGKSQVAENAKLGETKTFSLSVISNLTSDDIIEAIHFDKMDGGILKLADEKNVKINYPFSLSNFRIDSLLLKDTKNNLKVKVSNGSKRAYEGKLDIEILTSSQNSIITKPFTALTSVPVGVTTEVSDAEILINQDADIYKDITFTAKISQNGVLLGVTNSNYTTMAKASYQDKAKLPVIVADSNKNLNDLLDVIADFGGTQNVSILDLSLTSLNNPILNSGLAAKAIIVLDDTKNSLTASLNTLFSKSKESSFMIVNENTAGLTTVQNMPFAKDAQKLSLDSLGKRPVVFSNPYRADGVVGMSAFFATNKDLLLKDLSILSLLGTTSKEAALKLKSAVNRDNFFKPNDAVKVFSLRSLAELLNINIAYDKSGNIFTRNSKWADMVQSDNTLLINQLKALSNGDVNEEKLGVVLSAIAAKDFVGAAISNFYDIKIKMMPKILNRINSNLSSMEDSFKKSLKNFDKGLYNNAYDKVVLQRPFYIDPPSTNNNF